MAERVFPPCKADLSGAGSGGGVTDRQRLPYRPLETNDLRVLRAELERVREVYGRGSSQGLAAFQRLNAASHEVGRPLDGLRRFSTDEVERFFAQTVLGPNEHVYWDGSRHGFERNDGRWRKPARWWWEHVHGPIGTTTLRLHPTCDDGACINVEHQVLEHFRTEQYSESQMLGALQVMAMRLGRTPSKALWLKHNGRPSPNIYVARFSSWSKALRAAGLEPLRRARKKAQ